MINIGKASNRIHLAVGATDLRKGMEGLQGVVRGVMEMEASNGHVFVFCNRGKSRIKILYFDGSGMWVSAKRLEKGRFDWPEEIGEIRKVAVSGAELMALIEGLQLTQTRAKMWWRKKVCESA